MLSILPSTTERVQQNTSSHINTKIQNRTNDSIELFETRSNEDIMARLRQLDNEWDTERTLETNASALILAGTLLGLTLNNKWHILSSAVALFLLQHGLQGWCPPLPVIRRLGVRTPSEIFEEKHSLIQILAERERDQ